MRGRPHVGITGLGCGEADGVADDARGDLVVAHEAGQDREAGGVSRRPGVRPQRVRPQVEHRAAVRPPASVAVRVGAEQLVEPAGALVDDEDVAIAAGAGPTLDRRVGRDRVRARIALAGDAELDRHLGLAGVHDHVRDADRTAVPQPGAEVGVHRGGGADGGHVGRRRRIERERVDPRVPDVVGRQHRARHGATGRPRRQVRPGATGRHARRGDHRHQPGGHRPERSHDRTPPVPHRLLPVVGARCRAP